MQLILILFTSRFELLRVDCAYIVIFIRKKRVRKWSKSLSCSIYVACTHHYVSSNGKLNTDRTATIYHFPPRDIIIYTMYILLLCIKPPTARQTSSICFFFYSFFLIILHNNASFPPPLATPP